MSKKHKGSRNPDSLIVMMIPLIPRYHNKHFGATDEAEDTNPKIILGKTSE